MKKIISTLIVGLVVLNTNSFAQTYGTSTNYGGNTIYHEIDGINGTSTNYGGNTTCHIFDW